MTLPVRCLSFAPATKYIKRDSPVTAINMLTNPNMCVKYVFTLVSWGWFPQCAYSEVILLERMRAHHVGEVAEAHWRIREPVAGRQKKICSRQQFHHAQKRS